MPNHNWLGCTNGSHQNYDTESITCGWLRREHVYSYIWSAIWCAWIYRGVCGPYSQISISSRISEGSISNIYVCRGLSKFVGLWIIIVRGCMLGGNKNISWDAGPGSQLIPHSISLVKSNGIFFMFSEIVRIFMNVVKNCLFVLMIDVCKISTERHMFGFYGGFLCTIARGCIFVCITVWDCRRNWVTRGWTFAKKIVIYGKTRVIFNHLIIHVCKNKIFEEHTVFLHLINVGGPGTV